MVTMLQCNRLELKEMINQELAVNPVLEETSERDEATAEEVQALVEGRTRRRALRCESYGVVEAGSRGIGSRWGWSRRYGWSAKHKRFSKPRRLRILLTRSITEAFSTTIWIRAFDRLPRKTSKDPRLTRFSASPVSLSDHLEQQLSLIALAAGVREAADEIIGNLDEKGYLEISLEEIAAMAGCSAGVAQKALEAVQSLDPSGRRGPRPARMPAVAAGRFGSQERRRLANGRGSSAACALQAMEGRRQAFG
jgi:RNA polymerase sigma-54 factor